MNREEIIRMAREAGFNTAHDVWPNEFERFASLVAAAEREACAQICENSKTSGHKDYLGWGFAKSIRARGNK